MLLRGLVSCEKVLYITMKWSFSNALRNYLQAKVKVKVVCAKLTLARQLLFSLHRHFLFHKPQSQHTHIAKSPLSHRLKGSIESEPDLLETFKNDVMQRLSTLLSTLTGKINDNTATTIVRFALLAVDMDAEKLRSLVIMFYNLTAPSIECVAKLLVKLLELTPPSIQGTKTANSGEVLGATGLDLTCHFVLHECQYDFETTLTQVVWSPKPVVVADTLFSANHVTAGIIGKRILGTMADSDHLFVPQNFELFINTCLSCGPKLSLL
jgi:hypothetical protein